MGTSGIFYVLRYYPSVTETFIDREIGCLARRGLVGGVIAGGPEPGCAAVSLVPPDVPVRYVGDTASGWLARGLGAHLRSAARHPAALLRVWLQAAGDLRGPGGPARWRRVLRAAALAGSALSRLPARGGPLHAHFGNDPAAIARYVARATGRRYSFTVHAYDLCSDPFLLDANIAGAWRVVTVSGENLEELRARARRIGADPERVRLVHCGLDVDAYAVSPEEAAAGAEAVRLLTVGRLIGKKGHETLLRAVARLAPRESAPVLTVAGDGPLRARLESLAGELGIAGRVRFLGGVPPARVGALLSEADLFVLACTRAPDGDRDGIPVALVEALASGLPVVSTLVPGVREAVPEDGGVLVPPDDPAALAAALDMVISLPPDQRRAMGAAGRRAAREGFDLEECADRLVDALLGEPD